MFEVKPENSKKQEKEKSGMEKPAEEIISPESLAEQKISEMQSDLVKLEKDGLNQVDAANNLIGLDEKNALEIRSNLGVDEKLSDISGRAKELFKKTMKRMVVMGMATVAFSGAGKFEDNQHIDELYNTKSNEWVNPDTGKSYEVKPGDAWVNPDDTTEGKNSYVVMANPDDGVSETMEHNQEYQVEKIKDELIAHIGSQEYLDKLIIEFDGNIEKAKITQLERIENLETVKFYFKDATTIDREARDIPNWMPQKILDVANRITSKDTVIVGFYDIPSHSISIPNNIDYDDVRHELIHASTRGTKGITLKSWSALKDSYKKLESKKRDEYLDNGAERLVRKQALDREMENLGIKKYGEKFTLEHYNKIMRYYDEGILPSDAEEFIKTTKPEHFEKIFNEIADNEKDEDMIVHNIV